MPNARTRFKGAAILLFTSVIWGSAFVAQSAGIEKVDAFTFNGVRMLIGALVLFIFIMIRDLATSRRLTPDEKALRRRGNAAAIKYGSVLGVALCAASNFQQFAFYDEKSPGKIAFITALYMFFVPLIGLFFKKRVPALTVVFLCIDPSDPLSINRGDVLALICAALFAVQILLVEKFAPLADGVKISCVEFAVCGAISCVLMFIFEHPVAADIYSARIPILYAGVMSTGVAYTLQIFGQKYSESTVASLLMCTESVFAVLFSALLLSSVPTARETAGCVVMFAAIALSQIPTPGALFKRRGKKSD